MVIHDGIVPAGQGSAGQGSRQVTGHSSMQGPQDVGRGLGQLSGQGIPSSSHGMPSSGPAPALTPGRGPVSPGGLPSLSPLGAGHLLSPTSGLGNLFNEEASSTCVAYTTCCTHRRESVLLIQTCRPQSSAVMTLPPEQNNSMNCMHMKC